MAYDTIEYEERDGAAIVRFDRPERRNALSLALVEEFVDALRRAESADRVRAAVVTGNGSAFSSGYDLYEGEPSLDEEGSTIDRWLWDPKQNRHKHLFAIFDLHIPVIAAVNGPALAGGSDLAGVCDITIASERAEFGYPAIRAGAPPVTLTYPFVTAAIGQAKELLLTGKVIDAGEAERFGMVNRTVPHDDLMDEVRAEVDGVKKVPPVAARLLKQEANGVMASQGFFPHVTHSSISSGLVHLTETNQEFFETIEEEGLEAALEIYEREKY